MLYETSQPQVAPESLCPVPVLAFPVFLPSQFKISRVS